MEYLLSVFSKTENLNIYVFFVSKLLSTDPHSNTDIISLERTIRKEFFGRCEGEGICLLVFLFVLLLFKVIIPLYGNFLMTERECPTRGY